MPSLTPAYQREQLSVLLRTLRRESGLSTRSAAQRAGFGQPKLSKIEGGTLLPSFADAEALCRAYGASARQRDEVLDLLKALRDQTESARDILDRGAYRKQQQIQKIEADTVHYRDIQVAMVSGLLQTPAYVRRVMGELPAADQERAVEARRERQAVIADQGKRFDFVMTEGALRWRPGPPELMVEQIQHIVEVSRRPNVRVGVIDWRIEAPPGLFPGHEVHMYDDRLVIVGIETATAHIEDPRDIAVYQQLFARLEGVAAFGEDGRAILERIADDYRSLSEQ